MAEVYPSTLPLPRWGMSMKTATGVEQSDLSAKPRQQRTSYDNEVRYSLSWSMRRGHARLFRQWYVDKLALGRKWFTIDLRDENGVTTKTVRFTVNGRPRIDSFSGKIVNISATVVARSL